MGNPDNANFGHLEAIEVREVQWVEVPLARYEELIRAETELDILKGVYNDGEGRYRLDEVFEAIKKARAKLHLMQVTELHVEMKVEGEENGAEQNHSDGTPDARPGASSDR